MCANKQFGFSYLKNGLYFDVFSVKGLEEAIKTLGDTFAVIGVEKVINGIIPSYYDGIGCYYDGKDFYSDYILVFQTTEKAIFHRLVFKSIGWLFNQLSILLVDDTTPLIVDVDPIPPIEALKDAIALINDVDVELLTKIREGWSKDYSEQGVK